MTEVTTRSTRAALIAAEAEEARARFEGLGLWNNPVASYEREAAQSGARAGESQDTVSIGIPLVLSGRLALEREAAELGRAATDAQTAGRRAELRFLAETAFVRAVAATDRTRILRASLASVDELEAITVARERAGEAAGYDRVRVSLERALVDDALRVAVTEERAALTEAAALLGAAAPPAGAGGLRFEGPVWDPATAPDVDAAVRDFVRRRADLRALELEVQSSEAFSAAASRRWIPDPALSVGAQFLDLGQQGAGIGYQAGVSIPLPVFERGQRERAQASAALSVAQARRAQLRATVELEVSQRAASFAELRERWTRHRERVLEPALELRRIARAAYRGGAQELLMLMDAERVAREAELSAVELSVQLATAAAQLALVAGAWDELPKDETNR